MKLTAPDPAPRMRTCGTCKAPFATVPDDEREAFDLPAEVCTCGLVAAQAALSQAGFVPGDETAVTVSRRARWPVRYGPLRTTAVKVGSDTLSQRRAGHLVVATFVSPVIPAVLRVIASDGQFSDGVTGAQAELVATMLRRVTDPDMRAAMNTAVRIAGDAAANDLLFGPLRDAAGEDPDTREDPGARIIRAAAKLLRRGNP